MTDEQHGTESGTRNIIVKAYFKSKFSENIKYLHITLRDLKFKKNTLNIFLIVKPLPSKQKSPTLNIQ